MPKYEVEIDITEHGEALDTLVENLRSLGHPKIIFRVEGKDRRTVARDVANEVSSFWPKYGESWWEAVLKPIRGKRAQQDI